MDYILVCINLVFLFLEGMVSFSALHYFTEDVLPEKKTYLTILVCSLLYTAVFWGENLLSFQLWSAFLKGILLYFLSYALCRPRWHTRLVFIVMIVFIQMSISNISRIFLVMVQLRNRGFMISLIMIRVLYHIRIEYFLICLMLQVGLFAGIHSLAKKVRSAASYYQMILAVILSLFILFGELLMLFISGKAIVINSSGMVLVYCGFILSAAVLILIMVSFYSMQRMTMEKNMLVSMNKNISENYKTIVELNERLRSQAHDFRNHLLTMANLEPDEIRTYIHKLIPADDTNIKRVHSKDPYVNAIINSKLSDIQNHGIHFEYSYNVSSPILIAPAELCSVIGNQLDNAIVACQKIQNQDERWIRFLIEEQGDFIIFRCENRIESDLSLREILKTTKTDSEQPHGYGIKNIKMCTANHNGFLDLKIQDHTFISIASMQNIRQN